jgi:hypothetical protein
MMAGFYVFRVITPRRPSMLTFVGGDDVPCEKKRNTTTCYSLSFSLHADPFDMWSHSPLASGRHVRRQVDATRGGARTVAGQ